MKTTKKYPAIISLLLLLSFSVTIIPIDLFHHHNASRAICSDIRSKGICTHKYHISAKPAACWVCAIHYDKTFDKSSCTAVLISRKTVSGFSACKVNPYFTRSELSSLRGPPTV